MIVVMSKNHYEDRNSILTFKDEYCTTWQSWNWLKRKKVQTIIFWNYFDFYDDFSHPSKMFIWWSRINTVMHKVYSHHIASNKFMVNPFPLVFLSIYHKPYIMFIKDDTYCNCIFILFGQDQKTNIFSL